MEKNNPGNISSFGSPCADQGDLPVPEQARSCISARKTLATIFKNVQFTGWKKLFRDM